MKNLSVVKVKFGVNQEIISKGVGGKIETWCA